MNLSNHILISEDVSEYLVSRICRILLFSQCFISDPRLIYHRKVQHDASANKIKLVIPNEVFDSPYGDVEAISVFVEQVGDVSLTFILYLFYFVVLQ